MAKNFTSKNENIFECEKCNFRCSKKGDWTRHLTSLKHKRLNILHPLHQTIWSCEVCGKEFKHQSSLCKHRKKCMIPENKKVDTNEDNGDMKQLLEQYKNLVEEMSTKEKTVNNFNLNVFLNDRCKDAINISDFINSLQIQLQDLNYIKDSGFSEGLSAIIVNELKDLDESKRPLHCCDLKRDVIYIKDKGEWGKDNAEKTKMKETIGAVVTKCVQNITEWENNNPSCKVIGTKANDDYCALVKNTFGSSEQRTRDREINKIIKNVTSEIHIDKNKVL